MDPVVKILRKLRSQPRITEGTVVRFKVTIACAPHQYSFVALFVNGSWYTSGQTSTRLRDGSTVTPHMSPAAFEQVLRSPQVSDVAVATEWEEV